MSTNKTDLLGYVVEGEEHNVMVCVDCEPKWDDNFPRSEVRDSPAYGDKVPYPECYGCGEVMRPD